MFSLSVDNLKQWRQESRKLLSRGIHPAEVTWNTANQSSFNFSDEVDVLNRPVIKNKLMIPEHFFSLAENASCFRDDSRWALLYCIAWRIIYENKNLLHSKIDDQIARLYTMNKVIAREKHKMEAFLRFKKVQEKPHTNKINNDKEDHNKNEEISKEYYIAWFEPQHLILPAVTPFFVKRFYSMQWSILTPDLCVHWDGKHTSFTEGACRPPSTEDELELLWLDYYSNIFNPARLKLKAMQSEMPKKYWSNLPESPLIGELTRASHQKVDAMLTSKTNSPRSKIAGSRFIVEKQSELRKTRSVEN